MNLSESITALREQRILHYKDLKIVMEYKLLSQVGKNST